VTNGVFLPRRASGLENIVQKPSGKYDKNGHTYY